MASLETKEREPIELAFHQGMAYQTISVYLGIPEETIESRIRSGLRHRRVSIESPRVFETDISSRKLEGQEANRETSDEVNAP